MPNVYFIEYGCYLSKLTVALIFDSQEKAEKEAYWLAYQETDMMVGSHGFCDDREELLSEGYASDEIDEIYEERIEDTLDYKVELFDPEKHQYLMYDDDYQDGLKLLEKLREQQ